MESVTARQSVREKEDMRKDHASEVERIIAEYERKLKELED